MKATDNSFKPPVVKVFGKKDKYSEGKHKILITATDSSNNKNECKYYINVKSKSYIY